MAEQLELLFEEPLAAPGHAAAAPPGIADKPANPASTPVGKPLIRAL